MPTNRKRSRRPPRASLARRWGAVAAIVTVGYLYYHPLRTYLATRADLGARRAEVTRLGSERQELERRLAAATNVDAVARQARQLGYVRPGEHLYIVKGIRAWLEHQATIVRHGG